MTGRQRFAFEHPCFRKEECAAREHRRVDFPWSTILTLNIGLDDALLFDGLPLWHCSIAFLSWNGFPVLCLPKTLMVKLNGPAGDRLESFLGANLTFLRMQMVPWFFERERWTSLRGPQI
jgi:hypothetical protein